MFKILDQCLRLLFTGAALCLALEFMLCIFAPGNAETAWVFQTLHPVQPWLEQVCHYLTLPVDQIARLIQTYAPWLYSWLPSSLKSLFPVMPASVVAERIAHLLLMLPHDPHGRYGQDLLSAPYPVLFPGVVDWRLLIALPLWGWAESVASGMIHRAEMQFYRQSMKQQARSDVRQWQAQAPQMPQNPQST
jgi:hypothetical protein